MSKKTLWIILGLLISMPCLANAEFYGKVAGYLQQRGEGEAINCSSLLPLVWSDQLKEEALQKTGPLLLEDYVYYLQGSDSLLAGVISYFIDNGIQNEVVSQLEREAQEVRAGRFVYPPADSILAFVDSGPVADVKEDAPPFFADRDFAACSLAEFLYGDGQARRMREKVVKFYESVSGSSEVGYFDVRLKGCRVTRDIDTGSRYSSPEIWEGSKFLVLDVTYKNKDRESRIPFAGSAFISVGGSVYEFDQPESIMARGYGVPLQGINPLVTYRTKLVYRVPDESFRDVFWQPGRNLEGKRLYCSL